MWAVMTVVVVFEYTVGATLYKYLNSTIATFLAGILAVGIHWIASRSGEKFEPIVIGVPIFLLASVTTFSRFIPAVKAMFDYGAALLLCCDEVSHSVSPSSPAPTPVFHFMI
ncbi:unnamed protein product [Fraxinus pennsylvanica]|uniref:Uncharacterized protein n=1 Tax=Fraxinus pennsylvanica TaxID=56036 RepID=A0AAD1Z7I8_9LAMI|nr:unnamed protein product [Fraxinus pennsylvanica]